MSVIPTQKFRFLGGEVSPELYHSADMEQYGKWFSKAENIRFETLGAFKNRTGFEKVALSKSSNGATIKLLSFAFSRNESYLIEMGPNYFRFFKDGQPIYQGGDPENPVYEVPHFINITDYDIKYAQSGDVLYIVNGHDPVYTLTRNDSTGYNWTLAPFKFKDDCMPLESLNTDETKTLTVAPDASTSRSYSVSFNTLSDIAVFKNVTFKITFNDTTSTTISTTADTFISGSNLATFLNSSILYTTYGVTATWNSNTSTLSLYDSDSTTSQIDSIQITTITYVASEENMSFPITTEESYDGTYSTSTTSTLEVENGIGASFATNGLYILKAKIGGNADGLLGHYGSNSFTSSNEVRKDYVVTNNVEYLLNNYSFASVISQFNTAFTNSPMSFTKKRWGAGDISGVYKPKFTTSVNPNLEYTNVTLSFERVSGKSFDVYITDYAQLVGYRLNTSTNITMPYTATSSVQNSAVTITSSGFNMFADKDVNDIIAVNFEVEADSVKLAGDLAVNTTSDVVKTNGKYLFYTSGSWQGEITLEYSLNGSTDWKVFRKLKSDNKKVAHNENVSGTVEVESDVVYMRMKVTSAITHEGDYTMAAYLQGEKFDINTYYKIVYISSPNTAKCLAIKNNLAMAVGETRYGIVDWREGAFSYTKGWPSVVGLYQNRLFFGHSYVLYGSKTNEFENFYEPTDLKADDPLIMSLLSYRYNNIRNILTVRKFFVFSEEGEFGISSQAALTQADKNLIPLSYHGSSDCLPVLAGNLALFVDASERTVRLFKYAYETDSFEASDASVLIERLLDGRSIVTTDYIKKTKEALFLDNLGTIWIFKLMPEQEIYAWSHITYSGSGKITNIRVVPNGAEEDLYIAVEDSNLNEKRIEKLSTNTYYDSSKVYTEENATTSFTTNFKPGTNLIVESDDNVYKLTVGNGGVITLPTSSTTINCHYPYTSTATLLSPVQPIMDGVYTTYNKGKPFKVYFSYRNSYMFKVGIEEEEKMEVKFPLGDLPETNNLTSGKRSVLIPSRYDGSSRVTFIQQEPYPMAINNILIDMDYGGK